MFINQSDIIMLLNNSVVIYYDYLWRRILHLGPEFCMDCHTTARGSFPGGSGVFTELHVLRKGQ